MSLATLPFGNLSRQRKQAGSSVDISPLPVSNIITAPLQAAGASGAPAQDDGKKTPMDVGAPAQAPQTDAERVLGHSADELKLQQDHADLQKQHEQTQRQLEDAKRQAVLAKQQGSLKPATPAGNPSMDKYKSMSMQMMAHHLEGVNDNIKGLAHELGAMPMAMKLACALKMIGMAQTVTELRKSADGPQPTSPSPGAPPKMLGNTAQNYHPTVTSTGHPVMPPTKQTYQPGPVPMSYDHNFSLNPNLAADVRSGERIGRPGAPPLTAGDLSGQLDNIARRNRMWGTADPSQAYASAATLPNFPGLKSAVGLGASLGQGLHALGSTAGAGEDKQPARSA